MDQTTIKDQANCHVVIIDTGCANLSSVRFAVERLGYPVTVSREPAVLRNASKLFLPGVGTAKEAMKNLADRELITLVKSLTQPVLGICLGMQLLAEFSAEGQVATLGLIA
ncbi:MAG: imidazole glycerol phosphate synthase subunit HisH, partial [Moritella sp.]|uniref:glutamine amidotransferase-related protein n=1 Tax=Moritella sp. TaxID=78556 RepID=UPI0029AF217C|nr:imidazole glycerol phosphate synthase subunit HisH [Moritella sp.]